MGKTWRTVLQVFLVIVVMSVFNTGVRAYAADSKLDDIVARGYIMVGTTGDYKPMSYLNKDTGKYEGFDTEAAELLAQSLGVQVQWVPTTWKTLTADTLSGKFDIAMCGITRTFARAKQMSMSNGYLMFGKTILCRKADIKKFNSIADLNKKSVRVMVNPGGTNEKFAKDNLPQCTLVVHTQNAEIPGLVAAGKADVMITETMEARRYVRDDNKLAAPLIESPFTKNDFGILMQRGDQIFLNYVNMFMEEKSFDGTFDRLETKYIK
jgi:cyclohexadienyl dehydratase